MSQKDKLRKDCENFLLQWDLLSEKEQEAHKKECSFCREMIEKWKALGRLCQSHGESLRSREIFVRQRLKNRFRKKPLWLSFAVAALLFPFFLFLPLYLLQKVKEDRVLQENSKAVFISSFPESSFPVVPLKRIQKKRETFPLKAFDSFEFLEPSLREWWRRFQWEKKREETKRKLQTLPFPSPLLGETLHAYLAHLNHLRKKPPFLFLVSEKEYPAPKRKDFFSLWHFATVLEKEYSLHLAVVPEVALLLEKPLVFSQAHLPSWMKKSFSLEIQASLQEVLKQVEELISIPLYWHGSSFPSLTLSFKGVYTLEEFSLFLHRTLGVAFAPWEDPKGLYFFPVEEEKVLLPSFPCVGVVKRQGKNYLCLKSSTGGVELVPVGRNWGEWGIVSLQGDFVYLIYKARLLSYDIRKKCFVRK